jgi:hypothetical protein
MTIFHSNQQYCTDVDTGETFCHLSYEEAKYLVDSIQHEYLNKETYYFASSLFEKLSRFVKEHELARQPR